jgi:hypothetical protein
MKRYFPLTLPAVLVAILLTTCDTGSNPDPVNPLIGMWKHESGIQTSTMVFTDTEMDFKYSPYPIIRPLPGPPFHGNYTFTDSVIYVYVNDVLEPLGLRETRYEFLYSMTNDTITLYELTAYDNFMFQSGRGLLDGNRVYTKQ